eukprot:TRINITY_DN10200_c0_g1_i11.p1 TRINITY_DN10200_c0_g1~~TRINITY_DN10200_c0_g1_i11.p1  ORF type:complete len:316 (+),score=33.13 TRINITY_DN10200_c0_g1_i11:56-1003(+)
MTSKRTPASGLFAGAISGACSCILLQPLEVVKTHAQVYPTSSYGHILSNIRARNGYIGFWRGLEASLFRTVPGVGLYFATLHTLRQQQPLSLGGFQNLADGALARSFAAGVLLPMTVVKARMESGLYHYPHVGAALNQILKTEGIRGLYRGLTVTLLRDAPYSGLYLYLYERLKVSSTFQPIATWSVNLHHLTCGLTAGMTASMVTQPLDVIKTKLQVTTSHHHQSIFGAMTAFMREHGVVGLFRGATPRLLRRSMVAGVSWTIYEKVEVDLLCQDHCLDCLCNMLRVWSFAVGASVCQRLWHLPMMHPGRSFHS